MTHPEEKTRRSVGGGNTPLKWPLSPKEASFLLPAEMKRDPGQTNKLTIPANVVATEIFGFFASTLAEVLSSLTSNLDLTPRQRFF